MCRPTHHCTMTSHVGARMALLQWPSLWAVFQYPPVSAGSDSLSRFLDPIFFASCLALGAWVSLTCLAPPCGSWEPQIIVGVSTIITSVCVGQWLLCELHGTGGLGQPHLLALPCGSSRYVRVNAAKINHVYGSGASLRAAWHWVSRHPPAAINVNTGAGLGLGQGLGHGLGQGLLCEWLGTGHLTPPRFLGAVLPPSM